MQFFIKINLLTLSLAKCQVRGDTTAEIQGTGWLSVGDGSMYGMFMQ